MSRPIETPGSLTRLRRLPEKGVYDLATIYELLDTAPFCHVATIVDGRAVTLPTLHQRVGDTIYLHGSPGSETLRSLVREGEGYLTVTHYDGLRLARSAFHSSISYRSVVVRGPVRDVVDEVERRRVLDELADAILPGRAAEVRPMSDRELRLTRVVALEIREASAKISNGFCEDEPEDIELPLWAGLVPARLVYDEPVPAPDGPVGRGEVALPPSLRPDGAR